MKKLWTVQGVLALLAVTGCASVNPQYVECLQPNRRVEVEIVGSKVALPPKPKPGAEPPSKPAKPGRENVMLKAMAQGNSAFDHGSAALKPDGKAELDKLANSVMKGVGKDTRPTTVGAIVITGHIDVTEEADGKQAIGEARAIAARDHLVSRGLDGKLMFWESKGAKAPIPVTKFCTN
jgi:OmpA-OmpF porin, OOP family